MAEVTRVRCPICGAMPTLGNLEKTQDEKPAEVRIILQRFGGKVKVEDEHGVMPKKKKRGSAPGFIEYEDVTDQFPDSVKAMEGFFDKRIAEYQEKKK